MPDMANSAAAPPLQRACHMDLHSQELDYRAVFGTIAKWVTEIDDPARIPELVSRAFHTATNGRPGPVVIALPEDMLVERCVAQDAQAFQPIETAPGAADMDRLRTLLAQAE